MGRALFFIRKSLLAVVTFSILFSASLTKSAVVGIVGAGPTGIEVAKTLTKAGVYVILLERTPYVGGNVAHGYFYSKDYAQELKSFRVIARRPSVKFFGNVKVGSHGNLSLADLSELKLDALIFTSGASPRELGIPGEEHAIQSTRIFYYYNGHPDFPNPPPLGKRVAIIGSGSSAADIAKYLLYQDRGARYFMLARRGPGQYGTKNPGYLMGKLISVLDRNKYLLDLKRISSDLESVGEDPHEYERIYANFEHSQSVEYSPKAGSVEMIHLVSPARILTDADGRVSGLELERNHLVSKDGLVESEGTGKKYVLDVDTVIISAGGMVDSNLGLPIYKGRIRTLNMEDLKIHRDDDVGKTQSGIDENSVKAYFESRSIDHYRVDFSGSDSVPNFPVFVAGWARMPGIGSTHEGNGYSNVPDGRRLGELLLNQFKTKNLLKTDPRYFEDRVKALSRKLARKNCIFSLEIEVEPVKRPYLNP